MDDLHQPLHTSDRNDHGGNGFPVTYRGQAFFTSFNGKRAPYQLDHVWDDTLVDELAFRTLGGGLPADQVPVALAARLVPVAVHMYAGNSAASGNVQSWATDAHALASSIAYDGLHHGDDLGDSYINQAVPTVQDQLLKAGIRLAMILDQNS